MTENLRDHARAALAALDEIVAEHPTKTSEELAQAVRPLIAFRDGLIERRRHGGASPQLRNWLDQTNSIISSVVSCEFPLASLQRKNIKAARDALEPLLDCLG